MRVFTGQARRWHSVGVARRARFVIAAVVAVLGGAACGADPAMLRARETVTLSWRVVTEAERATRDREETDELRTALRNASARRAEASRVVDIWEERGVGQIAWETMAPCLAAGLAELERELTEAQMPVPVDLAQALEMAESVAGRQCTVRHRGSD